MASNFTQVTRKGDEIVSDPGLSSTLQLGALAATNYDVPSAAFALITAAQFTAGPDENTHKELHSMLDSAFKMVQAHQLQQAEIEAATADKN